MTVMGQRINSDGKGSPNDSRPRLDGEAACNIIADLASRPKLGPKVITFANEKGGVGKSTLAFHVAIALAHAGQKVVAIDLDRRQRTLERGLTYRQGTASNLGVPLPSPQFSVLERPSTATLYHTITRLGGNADFAILDAAGADSPIFRRAVAMADTLVTPVNASFLDLELLGHLNPVSGEPESAGCFGETVAALRAEKLAYEMGPIDWVVLKNRVRSSEKRHIDRVDHALDKLSVAQDFRIGQGLSERVAFRELFQFGLTHLDLGMIPDMIRPQQSSRGEIASLLDDLDLSFDKQREHKPVVSRPTARVLRRTRQVFRDALSAAL